MILQSKRVVTCGSSIVLTAELIGPQALVRGVPRLGKAHARSAAVLRDEIDPGLLKSQSQGSCVRRRHRDWPMLGFCLHDRGECDPASVRQVLNAPSHQSSRSMKLASSDGSEI